LLVNVAGFNASLNWLNSCEWLNVFTNAGHLFIHRWWQGNEPWAGKHVSTRNIIKWGTIP
jgi:hypothetical protein